MATYIQGLTDYIPQIQPFQPDLNFYGNVMQNRQSKYDTAKKKVSDLYGTLLYSPMLREGDIKRRDEFFKVIDNDIKRISGMDLSLQQNQDAAMGVFKGFYDDDVMVNDMVKTKNVYKQIDDGKAMQKCNDPAKCGGQYWEPGMNQLYYKMDEFKNSSDEESMSFNMGTFDPYFDWKKDAVKKVKEQGYEVKQDFFTGDWIVHKENGDLVQGGLQSFFKSLYGDDPRVQQNYKTLAYVTRKNATKAGVAEFGSEEEAEKHYIMKNINTGIDGINKNLSNVNAGWDQLNSRILQLDKKRNAKGGLTSREEDAYQNAVQQRDYLSSTKTSYEGQLAEIQKNIDANDVNSLRYRADIATASAYENDDVIGLAHALSEIKQDKGTYRVNPLRELAIKHAYDKDSARYKAWLDSELMKVKYNYEFKLEDKKQGIKTGIIYTEGTYMEGDKEGNVQFDVIKNPNIPYDKNSKKMIKQMAEADASSTAFLFNMAAEAKRAVQDDKSAGALQFLTELGIAGKNITSMAELKAAMQKKGVTSMSMYKSFIKKANDTKNSTGDYAWAMPLMDQTREQQKTITYINDAFHGKLNFDLKVNKEIVTKIKGSASSENRVARHADLLLTPAGFMRDEAAFVKKYKEAYEKEHIPITDDYAKEAYKSLKGQVYGIFNTMPNATIDQGAGLTGQGMMSAYGVNYRSFDAANYNSDPLLQDVINTSSAILASPYSVVMLGDASKKSLDTKADPKVKAAILGLINDTRAAANDKTPKGDRPTFNAKVRPIAAGVESLGAITYSDFNPDHISKYVGTKEKPGPLYGMDLSKGITAFYDNTRIETPFKEGADMSPLEVGLMTNGSVKLDSFEDTAGTVTYTLDPMTKDVRAVWASKQYINGVLVTENIPFNPIKLNTVDDLDKQITATLRIRQHKNRQDEELTRIGTKK